MIAAENLALHLRSEGILSIVLPAQNYICWWNSKRVKRVLAINVLSKRDI